MATMLCRHRFTALTARAGMLPTPLRTTALLPQYMLVHRRHMFLSIPGFTAPAPAPRAKDGREEEAPAAAAPALSPVIEFTKQQLIQQAFQQAGEFAFRHFLKILFGIVTLGGDWYRRNNEFTELLSTHPPTVKEDLRQGLDPKKAPSDAVKHCRIAVQRLGDLCGNEDIDIWVELADASVDRTASEKMIIINALRAELEKIDIAASVETSVGRRRLRGGVRIRAALGGLYVAIGETEDAEKLLVQAADTCRTQRWGKGKNGDRLILDRVADGLEKLGDYYQRNDQDLKSFNAYCEGVSLSLPNSLSKMIFLNKMAKSCSKLASPPAPRKLLEEAVVLQVEALDVAKGIKNKDQDFHQNGAIAWYNPARFSEKLGNKKDQDFHQNCAIAWYNLARFLEKLGNKDMAVEMLNEAAESASNVAYARRTRDEWLRIKAKLERAEKRLIKSTTLKGRWQRGRLLQDLGGIFDGGYLD